MMNRNLTTLAVVAVLVMAGCSAQRGPSPADTINSPRPIAVSGDTPEKYRQEDQVEGVKLTIAQKRALQQYLENDVELDNSDTFWARVNNALTLGGFLPSIGNLVGGGQIRFRRGQLQFGNYGNFIGNGGYSQSCVNVYVYDQNGYARGNRCIPLNQAQPGAYAAPSSAPYYPEAAPRTVPGTFGTGGGRGASPQIEGVTENYVDPVAPGWGPCIWEPDPNLPGHRMVSRARPGGRGSDHRPEERAHELLCGEGR